MSNTPSNPAGTPSSMEDTLRPSDPPRPLTRQVRRRTWAEASVRPWWIMGLVLLILGGYLISTDLARASQGQWLVKHGIKGEVRLEKINGETVKGKFFDAEPGRRFDLKITLPGREPYELKNQFLPENNDRLECKSTIPIYVDPGNPNRFTTATVFPLDIALYLFGAFLLLAFFLLAYAWFLRGRYLSLWKHGDAAVAVAVGSRQSPIAPFSRMVQCALSDHKSAAVFSLLVPNRMGPFRPGDTFWIIVNLRRPSRVLLAELYQQA